MRQESIYLAEALFLMRILEKKYKQAVQQLVVIWAGGCRRCPRRGPGCPVLPPDRDRRDRRDRPPGRDVAGNALRDARLLLP